MSSTSTTIAVSMQLALFLGMYVYQHHTADEACDNFNTPPPMKFCWLWKVYHSCSWFLQEGLDVSLYQHLQECGLNPCFLDTQYRWVHYFEGALKIDIKLLFLGKLQNIPDLFISSNGPKS